MLEKLAARGHLLEAGLRHEMVILAVDLVRPRRTRGVRDRKAHAWLALHERLDQAGLAGAGRCRDHVETPLAAQRRVAVRRRMASRVALPRDSGRRIAAPRMAGLLVGGRRIAGFEFVLRSHVQAYLPRIE